MKKNLAKYIALCAVVAFTSCEDFLNTMPDNRAEVNTPNKITALLVSAYPSATDYAMTEMASDNTIDNGPRFAVEYQEQRDAYLWNDIVNDGNDSPKRYWDACYAAIAAANQALEAIDELGNPDNLRPQRGEALLCRAYGHFALANVFCLPYNPQTAESDMGVPYSEEPETEVAPIYTRDNMKDLYEKINNDLEAGLPLIDDDIYSVPKYHFNKKAAYALAARFNLYYQQYDKVIEYANVALGATPERMMRNWNAIHTSASDWFLRTNMYVSASEQTNLLLLPVTSGWGYWYGPYGVGKRYGNATTIFLTETMGAGAWGSGSNLYPYRSVWGTEEKNCVSKMSVYFHYIDKVNEIGYAKNVIVAFSGDETLLCRAEAHALKGDLQSATADINIWLASHTLDKVQRTTAQLVKIYNDMAYMPLEITAENQRSPKKALNPQGFTVAAGDQENIIHCILHLRRVETVHEGLRWQDIKRYGIEITHNRAGLSNDVLRVDDPRRAIQLPQDVINAGLKANPRN